MYTFLILIEQGRSYYMTAFFVLTVNRKWGLQVDLHMALDCHARS